MLQSGPELRLPIDLLMTRPEEHIPIHSYNEKLQVTLGEIHSYAREKLQPCSRLIMIYEQMKLYSRLETQCGCTTLAGYLAYSKANASLGRSLCGNQGHQWCGLPNSADSTDQAQGGASQQSLEVVWAESSYLVSAWTEGGIVTSVPCHEFTIQPWYSATDCFAEIVWKIWHCSAALNSLPFSCLSVCLEVL